MLLFSKTQNWNQDFLFKKRLKTLPHGLLTCLPNLKKKRSTQEMVRKRNKAEGPKSRPANSPKEACHTEKREPLSTKTSTSRMLTCF